MPLVTDAHAYAATPGDGKFIDPAVYVHPPKAIPGRSSNLPVVPESYQFANHCAMPPRRRSLSNIFAAPFLPAEPDEQQPDKPPSDLLDDDPFANLSSPPALAPIRTPSHTSPPKSPLSPERKTAPSTPTRALSSGPGPCPAYAKPAFPTRPSLPSLSTLARMNVVLPRKVPRGRVGARLPVEPWNDTTTDEDDDADEPSRSVAEFDASPDGILADTPLFRRRTPLLGRDADADAFSVSPDFVAALEAEEALFSVPGSPEYVVSGSVDQGDESSYLDLEDSDDPESARVRSASTPHPDDSLNDEETKEDDVDAALLPGVASLESSFSSSSSDEQHTQSSSSGPPLSRSASSSSASRSESCSSISEEHECVESSYDGISETESDFLSIPCMPSFPTASPLTSPDESLLTTPLFQLSEFPWTLDEGIDSAGEERDRWPAPTVADPSPDADTECVDGAGWENGQPSRGGYTSQGYSSSSTSSRGGGYNLRGSASGASGLRGWSRDRGDEDEDEDRRPPRKNHTIGSSCSSDDVPTTDSETDSDAESDDYGQPSSTLPPPGGRDAESSDEDDDVPLAQSIPTALRAQRTIRIKAKEEREARRQARKERRERHETIRPAASKSRPAVPAMPARPPGAGASGAMKAMSSSQEAAMHASKSTFPAASAAGAQVATSTSTLGQQPIPRPRQRAQTMLPARKQPFVPDDLTRKLQSVEQQQASSSGLSRHVTSAAASHHAQQQQQQQQPQQGHKTLRPMRSFHNLPAPETDRQNASSSGHGHSQVPVPHLPQQQQQPQMQVRQRSKSMSRPHARAPSRDEAPPPLPMPISLGKADPRLAGFGNKLVKERHSGDHPSASAPAVAPAIPPLRQDLVASGKVARPSAASAVSQQRIFIGDMQSFNLVEVGPGTTAGDVIRMVEDQGSLKGWKGVGGWMLHEYAQDFGMERPIRDYELLTEVEASWNKDKMVNTFILKLTTLAPILNPSNLPLQSPRCSGYIEYEVKRGKWTKRWLSLREHSLYLAKRDNGKDEVFLCSLSNFDFYRVTRVTKAPKKFAFAIKSTDNFALFEDAADYLHMFSCNERDGESWMEKILLARSYVLHQERNVVKTQGNSRVSAETGASGLSRAATKKLPAQPLVHVSPPKLFEPGSLLHRG